MFAVVIALYRAIFANIYLFLLIFPRARVFLSQSHAPPPLRSLRITVGTRVTRFVGPLVFAGPFLGKKKNRVVPDLYFPSPPTPHK